MKKLLKIFYRDELPEKTISARSNYVRKNLQSSIFNLHFALLLISYSFSSGQDVKVTAKIDTTQIRIGEQFGMNLSVTAPVGTKLFFPLIPDTIKKLEVVKRSAIDTIKSPDGKQNTLQQKITFTSFDSGFYVIEPIPFYFQKAGRSDTDSVSTEAQLIAVRTIQVDTTKEIKDIKAPLDVPFTFREALPYIIGGLVLIALMIAIIVTIQRMKKKPVEVKIKVPLRPAHEIALEELKKTEAEKLWQQGFFKKYHSSVSDIIRMYIEHRFSINAMEFTTDETLQHFRGNLVNEGAKEKLKYLLQLADMVKFAKAQPLAHENEQSLSNAYSFIELTKPVTQDDFKEEKEATS